MTESFDPATGRTLSTGHTSHTMRRLLSGLDGRSIWFSYASRTDELRYDTSRPTAGAGTTYSFPSVSFETAAPGAPLFDRADDPQVVTARWDGPIHLRSDVLEMDNQGHAIRSAARGRDGTDEVITSVAKAVPLGSGGNWMWRPGSSWTEGSSSGATIFGHTTRGYNAVGDLILTTTYANLPITHATGFDFGSLAQINQTIMASSTFDVWGNATASCGGADLATTSASACLRYGTVSYDLDYSQFPLTEAIFTGPSSSLTTTGTWDRGLGVLRTVTDPNGFMTNVGYDGFGRVTFVRPPASDGCTSTMPVQHFTYSLTTDPAASPISTVIAYQENGCTPLVTSVIETRTYVDGLGRARATLSTAEGTGQWIQSGIALMNGRGTVRRTFQPERFSFGTNPTPTQALIVPSTPNELSGYDAFDRPTLRTPPTGGNYFTTYHALTRDECDPLDNGGVLPFMNTCTTIRLDGHGRVIDQILRNRQPGGPMEYYRLFTTYRADGAVTAIERAETTNDQLYGIAPFAYVGDRHITRTFTYDTAGRRIGTTDPDSDSYDVARTDRNRTWRYLFNPVGDLVAVRDPRGCGQDFFYDRAARLIAEDYIGCGESSFMNETTDLDLPLGSIGLTAPLNDLREVDVLYEFDTLPTWATTIGPGGSYLGRLGGVSDRGERSVMAYDARGQVVWTARQMAVIRAAPTLTIGTGADGRPTVSAAPTPSNRVYDTVASHTYMRTAHYDHGGRPTEMTLPIDPDYGGTAPRIGGSLTYNRRGLPRQIHLLRDDTPTTPMTDATPQLVVGKMVYTRDGLLESLVYGDDIGETREYTATTMAYDDGRRPVSMVTLRQPTASPDPSRPLGAVTVPFAQTLTWDIGNNLVAIADDRPGVEWPDGYRPQNVAVTHDALYRVVSADYEYATDDKYFQPTDTAVDWRTEANITRTDDPMRSRPAPMMDGLPASRPINMTWEYDWLGNAEEWTDDAHQFYERSIGDIVNGADVTGMERPGALRISTDLEGPDTDRGGWLEVDYGEDGNAVGMTVHAACTDAPSNYCKDTGGTDLAARRADIRSRCTCAQEQHYVYRWDEVNRIAEAMRFDRSGGSGGWTLMVRQRYLYDSANERTVKQTLDTNVLGRPEAVALYVYPGDFERRGLYRSVSGTTYDVHTDAETQYVVGGARLVWTAAAGSGPGVDREHRLTIGLSDLIQSTNVTLDLLTGELVETGNYYANGARESYRSGTSGERSAPEPMGFTGKEADEEVGLTYFGQRYLMAHLGRWASPDPLQTHAVGGGEALNGYHYVAGSVLQARDPQGLDGDIYEPPPVLAPEATAARDWAEVQSRFEGLSTRLGGDVHAVAELFRSSGWGRDRIMEGLSGAPHDPFLGRTTPTFRGMDNGAGIRPELQDGTTDQMRHIFSAMSIGYWFGRDGSRGLTGIAGVVGHELAGATNRIGQGAAGLAYADTFRTAVGYVIDASIRSEDLDYTRLDSLLAPIIAAGDLPAVNAGDGRSVADLRATVVGYAFGARLRESGVTTNGFASGGDAAAFIDRYVAGEPSTAAPGEPGPATPDGATPPDADR
jgi:RHS repeat-associated protein